MAQWFSEKKGVVDIGTMNEHHARNALAKLRRGDYFDAGGNPPSADEYAELEAALVSHLERFPQRDPIDGE